MVTKININELNTEAVKKFINKSYKKGIILGVDIVLSNLSNHYNIPFPDKIFENYKEMIEKHNWENPIVT